MKKPSIGRRCPYCKTYCEIEISSGNFALECPSCRCGWGKVGELNQIFESCPVCRCRQFYTSKDFNQLLGCFIMLIGIVLAVPTCGLSLPVFAFVDFLLFRRVPTMINCYKCASEFRRFDVPRPFKPFMHHIGLKYDKYR